jgi:hypothetical protein
VAGSFKKIKNAAIEAKLNAILAEPVGSPVQLTREEAIAIVQAGIGGRPDLPRGAEYVRQVSRQVWADLVFGSALLR